MAPGRSQPELQGRDDALAAVAAAIEGAVGGGAGGLVVLEGEAGIGKSRLIGEAAGVAEAAGCPWPSALDPDRAWLPQAQSIAGTIAFHRGDLEAARRAVAYVRAEMDADRSRAGSSGAAFWHRICRS